MGSPSTRLRGLALDWRVWALTVVFLGWYALGTVTPDASPAHVLAIPAFVLMYFYYATFGLLTMQFGIVSFWIGFALYCFSVAVLVVWSLDTAQSLLGKRGRLDRA